MKKIYFAITTIIIYSLLFSEQIEQPTTEQIDTSAVEEAFVNEKFQFIQDIYSQSWGLIIGINKYENVEPLTYAVNDAVAVREMLIENYGFVDENITMITDEDATKENILDGFSGILEKAGEKDRVIVFYAGHGETYKLPNGGDMGYLIPVDGNVENLYRSSIPMKSVYDIADMSYAKHILYLVDACYGGLTLSTRGLKKDNTPTYIKKMTNERGRMVITAGGKDEQVIEKPEWGHSAFTRNLLKGLGDGLADENADGIITGDELGGFIRNRVVVDVDGAHTPQKGRIGSEMGEFVFISETLTTEIDEAFPRDVQIANQEAEIEKLQRELKKKEQENKMKKAFIGNEYVNTDFILGRPKGFSIVSSFSSTGMDYETLEPPVSDEMLMIMEAAGSLGLDFGEVFGNTGDPEPKNINSPSFSIEKRIGPMIVGVGMYDTGYAVSQSLIMGMAEFTTTSQFRYAHLYTFYPLILSPRITFGAGLGYGVPMSGKIMCEGTACNNMPDIQVEKEDMGAETNLLINTSLALTNRFAVRLNFQQSFTEIGDYYPMILDDPNTEISDTPNADGTYPGNEARAGFSSKTTQMFGASLVVRF